MRILKVITRHDRYRGGRSGGPWDVSEGLSGTADAVPRVPHEEPERLEWTVQNLFTKQELYGTWYRI